MSWQLAGNSIGHLIVFQGIVQSISRPFSLFSDQTKITDTFQVYEETFLNPHTTKASDLRKEPPKGTDF